MMPRRGGSPVAVLTKRSAQCKQNQPTSAADGIFCTSWQAVVGIVTTFVHAVTTLSVVIFLFTPGTTVATITIFPLINDFNWGGATAFTVGVIGMAVGVLVLIWVISGRRASMQHMASG
jgi:hypothetical protein